MSLKNLIIVGAGGFGRELGVWASGVRGYGTEWFFKGYLDDEPKEAIGEGLERKRVDDDLMIGGIRDYKPESSDRLVCAIADPQVRRAIVARLKEKGARFANFVHSTAILSDDLILGEGNVFCPFVTVTCGVTIGDFNIFNSKTSIGHDVAIGAYNSVMGACNLGGGCLVGDDCFLGTQSVLMPKIKVSDGAKVGTGSVAIRSVPPNVTVFGCPAKRLC